MIKLTTISNMRKADEKAISGGISAIELMRRAALGLYGAYPAFGKIAIVSGNGNNGGDGYALADILYQNGQNVTVFHLGEPKTDTAKYYFYKLRENEIPTFDIEKCKNNRNIDDERRVIKNNNNSEKTENSIENMRKEYVECELSLKGFDIVYDCLLGTGARFLDESLCLDAVRAINNSGAFVISCDINSGLNGDSGLLNGLAAVRSDLTVSIGAVKTGLQLHSAPDYIKECKNIEIGIELQSNIFAIDDLDIGQFFSKRLSHTNKGSYGKCGILGGSTEYSGAIKLANIAQSTLLSGVGLCALLIEEEVVALVAPFLLESTVRIVDKRGEGYDYDRLKTAISDLDCILIGGGWGQNTYNIEIIKYILKNFSGRVVIDADALNSLAGEVDLLTSAKCKIVLTPHVKEMERLCASQLEDIKNDANPTVQMERYRNKTVSDMKKDAINIAEEFAKRYNVTLVLKDNTTIVAGGEKTYIITAGSPSMAKGGSGDVLAGAICGKLAQKQRNYEGEFALEVASVVYLVGKAGEAARDEKGEYSALPSDTVGHLSAVIKNFTAK